MKSFLLSGKDLCDFGGRRAGLGAWAARCLLVAWFASGFSGAAAVRLTWDPATGDLSLAATSLEGISLVEEGGVITVGLGAERFDPASTTAGVAYVGATPTASAEARVMVGNDCRSVTWTSSRILVSQPLLLRAGSFRFQAGAQGTLSVEPGGSVQTVAGDISVVADELSLNGPLLARDGTVSIAPATAGRQIALGGDHDARYLSLSTLELGQVAGPRLAVGDARSGTVHLNGVIAPTVSQFTLRSGERILQSAGGVSVPRWTLQAAETWLLAPNDVEVTTVLEGDLNLGGVSGPALSGALVVGSEQGGFGPAFAQWFGDHQVEAQLPLTIFANGSVDLNGYQQAVSALRLQQGYFQTQSGGTLSLTGPLTVSNPERTTVTLAGTFDLGGAVRVFDIDGEADSLNLAGDADLTGSLRHGGFVKTGPGALRMSGASYLEQSCPIVRGALIVDGVLWTHLDLKPDASAGASPVYLSGSGWVGSFTASAGALVAPGDLGGQALVPLRLLGGASTLETNSALLIQLRGTECTALVDTNRGTLDLAAQPELRIEALNPILGRSYRFIHYPGGRVTGHFRALPEGALLRAGNPTVRDFQIHYEPESVTLKAGIPTWTIVSVSAEVVAYGEPVTLTAAVQTREGGTPTGAIEFLDNGEPLATVPLTHGLATLIIATLPVGDHDIQARYGGDDVFLGSLSTSEPPTEAAPRIQAQPADFNGVLGGRADFAVTAASAYALTYQWRHNGALLAEATQPSLALELLSAADAGYYDVVVANAYGSVTSRVARLTVSTFQGFGDNRYGQAAIPSIVPAPTAVGLGWYHGVARLSDGSVRGWGDNSWGQLDLPSGLTNIVAVSAGAYHSLALKADGTVVSWGPGVGRAAPPAGLTNVVAVSAGAYHSLALRSDGTVAAWGYNAYRQCAVPEGLGGVRAIAAGAFHSVALRQDGSVVVWGNNAAGQAQAPDFKQPVVAIAAGSFHNLAILADGTIQGWGDNRYRQSASPMGLNDAIAVACGDTHSVALRRDGSVVAWGHNHFLQCEVPAGLHDAVGVFAGGNQTAILGSW